MKSMVLLILILLSFVDALHIGELYHKEISELKHEQSQYVPNTAIIVQQAINLT